MSNPITIQIEGVNEAIASLKAHELRRRGALTLAVVRTLMEGTTHIKRMISKTGPSRPFEPPGVQSGELRASYRFRVLGEHDGELLTDKKYAPWLEDGTAKMAPRPHARPTAEWMAGRFKHHAVGALKD